MLEGGGQVEAGGVGGWSAYLEAFKDACFSSSATLVVRMANFSTRALLLWYLTGRGRDFAAFPSCSSRRRMISHNACSLLGRGSVFLRVTHLRVRQDLGGSAGGLGVYSQPSETGASGVVVYGLVVAFEAGF